MKSKVSLRISGHKLVSSFYFFEITDAVTNCTTETAATCAVNGDGKIACINDKCTCK